MKITDKKEECGSETRRVRAPTGHASASSPVGENLGFDVRRDKDEKIQN
jgi:hypothetical protein